MTRDPLAVLHHYMVAALWSSHDWGMVDEASDDPEPLDANYGPEDIAEETRAAMVADVATFLAMVDYVDLDASWWTDEQMGHDLWLTRNGHGAGFWDRGQGEVGETLTRMASTMGEVDLWAEGGKVYQ